jgi:hypothetical protein
MRFLSLLAVLIFALSGTLMLAACGQASNSGQENAAEQAVPSQETTTESAPAPTEGAEVMNTAAAVGDHVELTGTQGCGHCQFGKGEGCSIAMQVGDVVYILDGMADEVEAFNQANAGKQISVVGTLTDAGDPHHIAVESHQVQM